MNCSCFDALLSRKKLRQHSEQELVGFSSDKKIKIFSYSDLSSATDNFCPDKRIGRGGFGTVYKGTLRNGVTVAIKVLSAESKQGVKEFLTEIDTIANVRHPNLVELIGCCVQDSSRILVYEHMENGSLDRTLLGMNIGKPTKLSWNIRSAICIGTARGLAYLHEDLEPPIVHRDIKASNILLDSNFDPKIGDFGLAKLFPDNVTHISTRVAGTTGYLAPEYALQGQLTKKADVYSFGVLVIEIISGRSISKSYLSGMNQFLLERTWQLFQEGRLKELIDPVLQEYPEEQVMKFIKPIRLNEKELTPPGYVEGSSSTRKASEGSISSSTQFKGSTTIDSAAQFTLSPITFTQLVPR
ncbi:putative serine/threonine-protein kinase isoform X2 [Musa acuminata AAA Group]|uniref:putative serine/threonine-protein kinase isoform X2 n=1 Tax=Musa acuminata AAA Group TaxID=214697 RepID=UPI0031DE183F